VSHATASGPSDGTTLSGAPAPAGATRWRLGTAAGVGLGLALAVRIALLPLPGLAGDLDDFATWAAAIARDGLGRAYDQPISFPPVLPWIWAGLGWAVPGLAHGSSADPWVRVLLKAPASLADLAIAAVVGWWTWRRAGLCWGLAAAAAIALAPAVLYLSALWGQFESIYVLPVVVAYVLAVRGRAGWSAVAAAVALMAKPQALPLMVPFAAWYLATGGWRELARAAIVGAGTIAVLWAPFLAAGGPLRYLSNLTAYGDVFAVVSLRAWNPWWILEIGADPGGGVFVSDSFPIVGPITFRVLAGVLGLVVMAVVAWWVARRPTPETLGWGLVAAGLGAVMVLTTMHERYAYPALVLLPLLWPDRRAVWLWAAVSVVFTANLLAAVPPSGGPGSVVPLGGPVGVAGSVAMVAISGIALLSLRSASGGRPATGTPPGTSGDSGAASAGA
jgi:dolichyl-phosphate-mannose-protein mannosyltransferase